MSRLYRFAANSLPESENTASDHALIGEAMRPGSIVNRRKPRPVHKETEESSAVSAPGPTFVTGDDALGEGDVSIALMSSFPPPKPDLR